MYGCLAHQQSGLSLPRVNRSQGQNKQDMKPGALIIPRGDSCRRQINVFHNSTLVFRCLSWREGKRNSAVFIDFISSTEHTHTHPPKQMQFSKWSGSVCGEGAIKFLFICANITITREKPWNLHPFTLKLEELLNQVELNWTERS